MNTGSVLKGSNSKFSETNDSLNVATLIPFRLLEHCIQLLLYTERMIVCSTYNHAGGVGASVFDCYIAIKYKVSEDSGVRSIADDRIESRAAESELDICAVVNTCDTDRQ